MKNAVAALVVGFIFSMGLGLSGMTKPQNVIGFLDLFGEWNPSLMLVMVDAILIHFVTYKVIRRRSSPLLSKEWHVPTKREITPALVIGSFIFGVGWALGGFCPGPALVSLATFNFQVILFIASMLMGMFAFRLIDKKLKLQK